MRPFIHLRQSVFSVGFVVLATVLSGCAVQKQSTTPAITMAERWKNPDTYSAEPSGSYSRQSEVMEQVPAIASRTNLPEAFVRHAIGNANFLPNVPQLILPVAKGAKSNWRAYRSRFVDPTRIRAGVKFWRENAAALQRAQMEFGVPAYYIVGIIGVETIYGRNVGNIRVIDALSTLSFDFPQQHPRAQARTRFFKEELDSYLMLCARNGDDPLAMRGSYAGAVGLPQFMPSNIIKYALDYDHDGRVDLFGSPVDAIGSVANYFKAHGWIPNLEPIYSVSLEPGARLAALLERDIVPSFTEEEFNQAGVKVVGLLSAQSSERLALIELENGKAPSSYYAGTRNFYVITRYNHSSYYAKAVIDLGEAVYDAMRKP